LTGKQVLERIAVVAVLFVRQRIEARKKQAEIQAKVPAAKRIQQGRPSQKAKSGT